MTAKMAKKKRKKTTRPEWLQWLIDRREFLQWLGTTVIALAAYLKSPPPCVIVTPTPVASQSTIPWESSGRVASLAATITLGLNVSADLSTTPPAGHLRRDA
jgi:hypothetical protein